MDYFNPSTDQYTAPYIPMYDDYNIYKETKSTGVKYNDNRVTNSVRDWDDIHTSAVDAPYIKPATSQNSREYMESGVKNEQNNLEKYFSTTLFSQHFQIFVCFIIFMFIIYQQFVIKRMMKKIRRLKKNKLSFSNYT